MAFKNSENYNDPTAGRAIENCQNQAAAQAGSSLHEGDIYRITTSAGKPVIVLIMNVGAVSSTSLALVTSLDIENFAAVAINGEVRYANCARLRYDYNTEFTDYIGTASERDMQAVRAGIARAFKIEQTVNVITERAQEEKPKEAETSDKMKTLAVPFGSSVARCYADLLAATTVFAGEESLSEDMMKEMLRTACAATNLEDSKCSL